jgi:hypothetical protein
MLFEVTDEGEPSAVRVPGGGVEGVPSLRSGPVVSDAAVA